MDFVTKLQKVFSQSAKKVTSHGTTFWLSSYVTAVALFAAAIVMTSRQYWGDPIDCTQSEMGIPGNMLDTYCWVHTTHITPRELIDAYGEKEDNRVSPGLPRHGTYSNGQETEEHYITYYQWIVFGLLAQTALAAIPWVTWKAVGGGRITQWIASINEKNLIEAAIKCENTSGGSEDDKDGEAINVETEGGTKKETKEEKDSDEIQFISIAQRLKCEANTSALGMNLTRNYLLCEWLTLFSSQAQFWFLVWFLGQNFLMYGLDFVTYDAETDPLKIGPEHLLFPLLSKCNYKRFGQTMDTEHISAFCLLPANIFNQRIFLAIWFWLKAIFILNVVVYTFHMLICTHSRIRVFLLKRQFPVLKIVDKEGFDLSGSVDLHFMVYLLGRNVHQVVLGQIARQLFPKREPTASETVTPDSGNFRSNLETETRPLLKGFAFFKRGSRGQKLEIEEPEKVGEV